MRRSVPQLVGIQLGFQGLLWLAAMILREALVTPAAATLATTAHVARPMSWLEATTFQLINAKAWIMSITVATAFYGDERPMLAAPPTRTCPNSGTSELRRWKRTRRAGQRGVSQTPGRHDGRARVDHRHRQHQRHQPARERQSTGGGSRLPPPTP